MAAPQKPPKSSRALASETQNKGIKEFLAALAPEKKTLAVIRAAARKKAKNKLSVREIDREIRNYRRRAASSSNRRRPTLKIRFPHPPCQDSSLDKRGK